LGLANWVLVALVSILFFVFSLPSSTALRNLLLIIVFVMAFKPFWETLQGRSKPLLYVVILFALLQVLALFIAVFKSGRQLHSLLEWKGQWLPAFMMFAAGIGLARVLVQSKLQHPHAVIAMVISIPVLAFLLANGIVVVYATISAGAIISNLWGIGEQKGIVGNLIILLGPILIAEQLSRQVNSRRLLPFPTWGILAVFVLLFFTLFAASSRNGLLILLLCTLWGGWVMVYEVHKSWPAKKVILLVLVALTVVVVALMVSYKFDPRWHTFLETIPLAWDIDRDLFWLRDDGLNLPLTPSGQPVDTSQYYRIAWAHEGWRMLMEHPWGVEIARDAFQRLVLEKYGQAAMAHTHNSWLDMGLQVGIPGLLIWGWILGLKARYGWQVWRAHRSPLGIGLAAMVFIYAAHGMLDSIFREHQIQQFMLAAGLLFGAIALEKRELPYANK